MSAAVVLFAHPALSFALASTPPPDFDPNTVTPGPWGFLAILLVAIGTVLLGFDMVRRIRRTTYRVEIQAKLQAEVAAAEAEAAARNADAGPEGADPAAPESTPK